MDLNKNGWGLREMLVLSGILVLFLGIAIFYIVSLYNEFEVEASTSNYYRLEEKLETQASIYLDKYYDEILTSDPVTITRSILNAYNLDTSLMDPKGDACTGYVRAYKTRGNTEIIGYISCKNYVTEGYEEWRD